MNHQSPSNQNAVTKRTSRLQIILASLLALLAFPYQSPAPIYGYFPGMSNLLARAEVVVVADLGDVIERAQYGGYVSFQIRIRKVLKGEAEEGETYPTQLRDLGFHLDHPRVSLIAMSHSNRCDSLFPEGRLKAGARGVFFLKKNNVFDITALKRNNPAAQPMFGFRSENCEGDAFAINPSLDLKKLDGLGTREASEFLLKDSMAYYGERFPIYKKAITMMLASP